MTPEDTGRFRSAMAELYALYDKPADEVRTKLYWNELREFPLEAVLHAFARAKRECEWFPAVAKLRQSIVGRAEDEAEAAWEALCREIRHAGYYRTPMLTETLQRACNAVYGDWQSACESVPAPSARGYDDHRRRFLAAYRVQQGRLELPAGQPVKLLES